MRLCIYASPTFLFSAHNLAAAISHVNTSFLLALQHDYVLARPFDAPNLLRTMVDLPASANVLELTVMPTKQPFQGRG